LFLAGVPIVAIMVALYMLRDWDTMTIDGRRAAAAPWRETAGHRLGGPPSLFT